MVGKSLKFSFASVILALSFISTTLNAQSTDAIVSGTVSDSSGAVVAGAVITANNTDTGIVTTTSTNGSGVYTLPPLPYGKYDIKSSRAGFRENVTAGIVLQAATKITLNSVLQIGATSESIEVQAEAAGLTVSTATIGGTVEGRRLQDLPITGRDAMNYLYTQAGIGSNGTGFNGTRSGTTNITTDGINTSSNRLDGVNTSGIVTSSGLLGTTAFQSATHPLRSGPEH